MSSTRCLATILAALALFGLVACEDEVVEKVIFLDRSSCEACHQPVEPDGTITGLEQAHPAIEGELLGCTDCHGGDPEARAQSEAHVSPGTGAARYVRNLTVGELDDVELAYLRFVNPGDFRVAPMSCGGQAPGAQGSGCHQEVIDAMATNPMSTFAGELGVGRYRAGLQRRGAGIKSVKDIRNPNYRAGEEPGTAGSLDAFDEPRINADEREIGPYQDLYFAKACLRCHLWSFGDNKFPGDFRSSGCSGCHMIYANDGLSRSADTLISKDSPPHPIKHELTTAIPSEQCEHCHYRGGRIGPNYAGYRESGGTGTNPESGERLGEALHGHDANYYITDEDTTNNVDETPPDVHQQAGMHCIDCHTSTDVHGDGNIYTNSTLAVEITCEGCHGTTDAESTLETRKGRPITNLDRDDAGNVWLTSKVTGERHPVTQIKRSVDNAPEGSALHASMGRDSAGFSHTDGVACFTCHSAWIPTCFGCHVTVDMREQQRSLVSGRTTPGLIKGDRAEVETDVLILSVDSLGRISPSMPAERMFFNATNGDGELVIDNAPRTGPNGEPGMGHRAFNPHTVQRVASFSACDRCHPNDTGSNLDKVYQAIGLGSGDFVHEDGEGRVWLLDQILDDQYESNALFGQDEPEVARPLPPEVIERMLEVEVENQK